MITAFVSISSVMSTSLSERKRQLAMLRCIGMEKRKGLLMALGESLVMVSIGIAAGFLVGIGAYLLTLFIQKELLEMHVYYAFTVHPVIAATTVDPYILPAAACFITGFLATLIPYLIELNKSPVEGLHDNTKSRSKPGIRVKGKAAVLGKISGGFKQNISFFIIVTVVIWAAVFGYSFFAAQTEINTRSQRDKLDAELMGLDYLAQRSEFYALGNAQLNRHNLGLSPESVNVFSDNNNVETVFAAIEAKSTKAVYNSETVDKEIANALSSTNSYNQVLIGDMGQLKETMSAQGYLENEVLYNIPTLGVSEETLDMLSEFIIEGSYNKEKLLSGEEILILNTSRNSPYSVGDIIPMTDIVIDEPEFEEFDFSYGAVPENAVPSFYYVFPDDPVRYEWPCYAFGTRQDYSVTVGGIVNITDENIRSFFRTDGLVGNCGFNILCADSALEKWGLPDRNPTKLGVKLSKNANLADFEKLWFSVIGSSSKVGSSSVTAIRRGLNTIERSNMSIFAAVIITVVILGLVGIVNSVNLRVRRGLRSYSTLRAVGLPKKGLIALIMRQGLIYAVMGAITSLIPLGVYEAFRRTAQEFISNGGGSIGFDADGRYVYKWQHNFPTHIELWKQPIFLIIL
ncbi:MAG: ABC transporter permease, partial [Oscillospiraceae bacterium]|nr:ABC transporter permease [Oscillospiraceae bacterium]